MKWQWPWVSRRRSEAEIADLDGQIRDWQRAYRERAEEVLDLREKIAETLVAGVEWHREAIREGDVARDELNRSLAASRREAGAMRGELADVKRQRGELLAAACRADRKIDELRATLARVSKPAAKTRYAPPAAKGRAS